MTSDGEITRTNFRVLLAAFMEREEVTVRSLSKVLECPEPSILRILEQATLPSDEMMKQGGVLFELGFKEYAKLTKEQKKRLSKELGEIKGSKLAFGSITTAVGALGLGGLVSPGIASGLTILGGLIGGGMAAGIAVAAAIPVAAGAAGYGIFVGIKYLISDKQLPEELDPSWERPLPPQK